MIDHPFDTSKVVLWVISDGRKGHEKQSTGLALALEEISSIEIEVRRIPVGTSLRTLKHIPKPDLVVGTGNATHFPLLVIKLLFDVPGIVLMKPSLPSILYDLVLVPHHDSCTNFGNVHTTIGVLSPVPEIQPDERRGVILLGGHSRHFKWDTKRVVSIVKSICTTNRQRHWAICDSPRSPSNLLYHFQDVPNSTSYEWQKTNESFITDLLGTSSQTWVTCDSVSMLYEALHTGFPIGVIDMPSKQKRNKLLSGIAELVLRRRIQLASEGLVIDKRLPVQRPGEEVLRCAKICLNLLNRC